MDKEAYAPSTVSKFKKLVNSINNAIGKLQKARALTRREALAAKASDAAMACFYGLLKVCKQGVPLRPIVSLRGTPTFGLSKWLYQRLCFLTKDSEWTVKSAEEFLTRIEHLEVEADEVMVSFDVISLFTSIPPALAIDTIDGFLREKYDETDQKLKRAHITELLELCLKTFFSFNDQVHEQKKGDTDGRASVWTNCRSGFAEARAAGLQLVPPRFWARYVDDTVVVIKRSEVQDVIRPTDGNTPDVPLPKITAVSVTPATSPATTTTITSSFVSATDEKICDASSTTAPNNTAPSPGDVDSTPTCLHCDRTFASRIGLVGCLRIHRNATGAPVSVSARRLVQQRLREMQDAWTTPKAEKIQGYADRNEWKNFFAALKVVYGPPAKANSLFLCADGSTLLTEKTQILHRWTDHFRGVLNRASIISDAAIARLPQMETNTDLNLPLSLSLSLSLSTKPSGPGSRSPAGKRPDRT
ncbi:hypothetical protein SprV_0602116900 [Sparganum proliferum]